MSISFEKAEKMLAEIPKGLETAAARAFNRALDQGRSEAVRQVTAAYTVKAKAVRATFTSKRANRSSLEARLISRGGAISLGSFQLNPRSDTTGAKRKQVRVAVKKGGLKSLGDAFVWNGQAFIRRSNSSLPVDKLWGPSVPGMLGNEDIVDSLNEYMAEVAEKRFDHEVQYLLERGAKNG